MVTSYVVPARDVVVETDVERSVFRGTLERVESEETARAVVDRLRRAHPDARHHCSAFVLGAARAVERASDDGEPAGTAGAPMLEVLRGSELSDVVVVVSRWFGGTLLGAGGLVRAYAGVVREAVDAAGTRRRRLLRELTLEVGHADAGRLESELRTRGVTVLDATYGAAVTLLLAVPPAKEARLHVTVAELTAGAALAVPTGERWVDVG